MNKKTSGPLHIVAIGAASSIGSHAAAMLPAVRARISNVAEHPYLLDVRGENYIVAMAPYVEPERQGVARFNPLLNYALSDVFTDFVFPSTASLVLCLPNQSPVFTSEQASNIVAELEADCEGLSVSPDDVILQGHAAAYMGLMRAQDNLEQHEFCILAAVDSVIDTHMLNWLDYQQVIHNTDNPYGFTPGEAASCVVLCTQSSLEKYSLTSLGSITAFASAREPVHHTQGVCTGRGLTDAIRQVVEQGLSEQKIGHTICDINGQPHRSDEYGFTLTRLSDCFDNPDNFVTPADCWGDVGAATGVLQMILATEQRAKKAGSPVLLWASSAHDLRGAALFQPREFKA